MLIRYFERPSLNLKTFLSKLPVHFHKSFQNIFNKSLENNPDFILYNLITLDKSQETGYFILLRFRQKEYPMQQCEMVFELETMEQFCWDRGCTNIREYYAKHEEFLKQQLLALKNHDKKFILHN